MSIDRCDVQFETNACAKEIKQPTKASWMRLKRLAREPSQRVVLMKLGTGYDPHEAFLRVWSDSDWAGGAKDKKNQSSLKIEVGGRPLDSSLPYRLNSPRFSNNDAPLPYNDCGLRMKLGYVQQDNRMCAVCLLFDTKRLPDEHKINGVQCA